MTKLYVDDLLVDLVLSMSGQYVPPAPQFFDVNGNGRIDVYDVSWWNERVGTVVTVDEIDWLAISIGIVAGTTLGYLLSWL